MIDLTLKAFPGRAFCLFSEKWIEFFFLSNKPEKQSFV